VLCLLYACFYARHDILTASFSGTRPISGFWEL
jgi:hypothetical protein